MEKQSNRLYPNPAEEISLPENLIFTNQLLIIDENFIFSCRKVLHFTVSSLITQYFRSCSGITEIVTDYGGYFRSASGSVNTIKPDNTHNLVAFTYNGIRYSTCVNNNLLTANGLVFQSSVFRSLPMNGLTGTPNANTKTGLGALYDGVSNGPSNPVPVNNIPLYLTDGINGLNLGTGIANLPAGTIDFIIDSIKLSSIGDGVPDILITQIADPSSGTDQYSFLDNANQLVGIQRSISFNGISTVANWTADFYEASTTPMTLSTGFTQTDRPLRLWAADFSYFGITAANHADITRFRIQLNGNSDIAFIAYNATAAEILPVKLSDFNLSVQHNNVQLKWETQSEINTSHFEIERSTDAINFQKISSRTAEGNSVNGREYIEWDRNLAAGIYFYRLKMIDLDGTFKFSEIIKAQISAYHKDYSLYPNPAVNEVYFMHPKAASGEKLQVFSSEGKCVYTCNVVLNSTQTEINISRLPKGSYMVIYSKSTGLKGSGIFVKP